MYFDRPCAETLVFNFALKLKQLVNRFQRITVHSVTTHDFQCMQALRVSTDNITDVIVEKQVICEM